jgi:hypothetical protein
MGLREIGCEEVVPGPGNHIGPVQGQSARADLDLAAAGLGRIDLVEAEGFRLPWLRRRRAAV